MVQRPFVLAADDPRLAAEIQEQLQRSFDCAAPVCPVASSVEKECDSAPRPIEGGGGPLPDAVTVMLAVVVVASALTLPPTVVSSVDSALKCTVSVPL